MVAQYWLPVAPKAANAWLYNFELRLLEAVSLIKTDDFSSVFALKNRRSRDLLQVLLVRRQRALGYPRLGLVVSKKTAKRAHDRN